MLNFGNFVVSKKRIWYNKLDKFLTNSKYYILQVQYAMGGVGEWKLGMQFLVDAV